MNSPTVKTVKININIRTGTGGGWRGKGEERGTKIYNMLFLNSDIPSLWTQEGQAVHMEFYNWDYQK